MTEFKAGEEYKTRDGSRVIVDATDRGGKYPIHGAVLYGDEWLQETWTAEGQRNHHIAEGDLDLMPPLLEFWVNVYPDRHPVGYKTEQTAMQYLEEGGETIHVREVVK